ncbi:polysaccharide pyruvyl transferase CsaB [Altericista sp. CCNU0014]|uniref:polysaccharide pyruvyl transferase CsaB n=1 Tax=Altericista sp. CCNU0014 TaxID=3082949 RepID=UPI0038505EC9
MRAVLCGYYGYGNGGDEALLATLLQFLPKHISPVVLSGNPAQTQALHGVATCDRNNLLAVFNLLRSSQVFIWGGGSLIQDSTSALSPWYYCGLMLTARLLGLKTIAWAQGIGPLHRAQTQWIAKQAFKSCTAISVRDPGSMAWVDRWHCKAIAAPDPVWALDTVSTPEREALPTTRIAVVLRSHPLLTPDRLDNIARALEILHEQTRASIVLVPFQHSQDLAIAQTLHAQLTEISHIVQLTDPRQLKGVFQGADMAIAMRLHGLIMAAAEGCRCFGISYDPKVQRLIEEINCPGWDLANFPEDVSAMAREWIQLYRSTPTLSQEKCQTLTQQARQHQQVLETLS